jgi:hypothetical protein
MGLPAFTEMLRCVHNDRRKATGNGEWGTEQWRQPVPRSLLMACSEPQARTDVLAERLYISRKFSDSAAVATLLSVWGLKTLCNRPC